MAPSRYRAARAPARPLDGALPVHVALSSAEPGGPDAEAQAEPNHLLALLPRGEYEALVARAEVVSFARGDALFEPRVALTHVYFPRSGEFSVVRGMGRRGQVEVATIGREGMVWLDSFFGAATTPLRCFTQLPGAALCLTTDDFAECSREGSALRHVMRCYAQAVVHQMAQTIACNRLHTVEQRCARWLLMTHDRAAADTFPLTHEFLAAMLGVRRAGVTVAEGKLRRAGLIRYTRGAVTVVDRCGLEAASCECYRTDGDEYARLLGDAAPRAASTGSAWPPVAPSDGLPAASPALGR